MKTRIEMKIKVIWLHCLPPLRIKQGQNTVPECLQPLYWHVQLVTSCFSCASSNFCRRARPEKQLSPVCPSPVQPSRYSPHLWAAAGCLTICHAGLLPTGIWASGLWHPAKAPRKIGICWISGIVFPHSTRLARKPFLITPVDSHTGGRICIPKRRDHPPPIQQSLRFFLSPLPCEREVSSIIQITQENFPNRKELTQPSWLAPCGLWLHVCMTETTRPWCQLRATSLHGITSQVREIGV